MVGSIVCSFLPPYLDKFAGYNHSGKLGQVRDKKYIFSMRVY